MDNVESGTGLYWRPLGGNNIDQISGHCYQYTCAFLKNKKVKYSSIIVDLGKFDNHQALGVKDSVAAVADIRRILTDEELDLKAIFITHSHPDHLNGIVHYIRAGYKLPKIYGGKYTKLILNDLYKHYGIKKSLHPKFTVIKENQKIKCGKFNIEVIPASHTCFDSFGFIIDDGQTCVYHSGDMKTDQTLFYRAPTDLEKLKEKAKDINFVVADFYGVDNEGLAYKEADVLNTLIKIIKKSRKKKIFLPVYPTHTEMYILAFLAALKLEKNVIFYGDLDFYTYLDILKKRGIDFVKLAEGKIKVIYGIPPYLKDLDNNFVVIGNFNDVDEWFEDSPKDTFALITAQTYFNPLKGQMNSRNIKYITLDDYPILQGSGHGFLGDWEKILKILPKAVFIPMHCPCFVAEYFKELGEYLGFNLINPIARNNYLYKFNKQDYELISKDTPLWLVATSDKQFVEVVQKPTSGIGFLKRTFSQRRTKQKFKMILCKRKNKDEQKISKTI